MKEDTKTPGANGNGAPEQDKIELEGQGFMADFRRRIREVKTLRWIRFIVVSILFCLWVVWMGNAWLGLFWLLLLDIYITAFIPWTWWRKSNNRVVRTVMSWVDAIVYALVLVYFIFIFLGQQYNIPSSSLEKSLLVGDYLWVNKFVYGPRVPQTPLHFPLAQHTLPMGLGKSYIENPQLSYHRLPGLRSIDRGDIVVFNYPQGDTVCLKIQNPDYYQIINELKNSGVENPREYIRRHPEQFGEVIWRPVDRRENYVKRAIGLPGERLKIADDVIYIDGRPIKNAPDVQFNYIVYVKRPIADSKLQELGVRLDDRGNGPLKDFNGKLYYNIPLTQTMLDEVKKWPELSGAPVRESKSGMYDLSGVFPLGSGYSWTRDNMGTIWIPRRGSTIHLTRANLPIYERAIRTYEGNKLEVKDGKIYINDKQTDYYTFKMDYYWMMGDNRDRSLDSRYWGLVPEDHIVGSPAFVVFSVDDEKGLFGGGMRWNRILSSGNPGKHVVNPEAK